jgi:hypothetical protein
MSGLRGIFRTRKDTGTVQPAPLVPPRPSVDGWTLDGTPLAATIPRRDHRELCTLLHGVAIGADTPYTYARAAELLEQHGEAAQAHAVCEAWFALPFANHPAHSQASRALARQRDRLGTRLLARPVASRPTGRFPIRPLVPETVFGLPLHVLAIHAVVVLVPLATIGVLLMAVMPRTRPILRWPVLFVLTAGLVSVPVTTRSGLAFKDRLVAGGSLGGSALEKVTLHQQLGELVIWPTLAAWLLTLAFLALERTRCRAAAVSVVAALAVLASVAATVQVVRTGHAGATAVWNPGG